MNKFLDDIEIYSIIEIKNDKKKYCVVGKDDTNSIYIRPILKTNNEYYLGKNKTKSNFNNISNVFHTLKTRPKYLNKESQEEDEAYNDHTVVGDEFDFNDNYYKQTEDNHSEEEQELDSDEVFVLDEVYPSDESNDHVLKGAGESVIEWGEVTPDATVNDDDSDSDSDIDPEENAIDDLNEVEPELDVDEPELDIVEPELDIVEPELDVDEPELDNVYELDENNVEIEESENIVIYEESIIPEDKVIYNDKIQEDDLLNELIKLDPTNSTHLKKRIKNFIHLKEHNSTFDAEKNITGFTLNDEFFKPLKTHLTKFKSHVLYKPIVSEKRRFYEVENIDDLNDSGVSLKNINLLTSDDSVNLEKFSVHFKNIYDVNKKYKLGDERVNYSYKKHTNEIYELMDAYKSTNKGYVTDLKTDTEVFSNCFKESCKQFLGDNTNINRHILLGKTSFNDNLIVKGDKISNVGFVKLPEHKLNEELYNNNKSLIENSNTQVHLNMSHLEENIISDTITSEYMIGDSVTICIEHKLTVKGKITNITDEDYIIDLMTEPVETLRINKTDTNVRISKIVPACLDLEGEALSVYLYDKLEVNEADLGNYLTKILPDLGNILSSIKDKENYTSLDEFKEKLFRYGYNLENIPSKHFKTIKTILSKNNKLQKTLTKQSETKDKTVKENRNFTLVNNYSLDRVNYYYGDYPYYNSSLDSENTRLEWLKNSYDNGALFFKTITHAVNSKFLENNVARLDSMIKVQEKLIAGKDKLVERLEKELSNVETTNKCGGMRLVKTYTDIDQLKNDNDKVVYIEDDKLIEGESTNKVQPGQFAILIEDYDKKKIYKRQRLETSEMWVIEKDLNIDMIISSYKDFCIQQGMSIEEIDTTFLKGKNRCKYSEHYKRCLPIKIIKIKNEIDNLNQQLEDITRNIEDINNKDKIIQSQEDELLLLRHELESDNNRKLNLESYRKDYKTNNKTVDDVYQYHYYRIDKYLENIKPLPINAFYTSLALLLDKYGRSGSEIDGENINFFYSRPGTKQIICKHHSNFMDYNNKIITFSEALSKTISDYGVEHEGYIWCNNCGEQINGADFETQEGFLDSGARDVTHEVIEGSDDYKSEENSELIEVLRKSLLQGDDTSIENQGLSVLRIISVLTNIMGLKLSNSDELAVLTLANTIESSKIKNKSSWIQFAKQKQKKASISLLETAYNNYRIRLIILYTTAILFLFIQSGVPEYSISKTFSKCKPSLRGYPLDKVYNQEGIDYMVCVLDSLSSLGADWSSLRKIKTKEHLLKKIDEFYSDPLIKYRFDSKRTYLKEQNKEVKDYTYEWNEFRPPLKSFDVDIKELTSFKNIPKYIQAGNSAKVNSELHKMKAFESSVCLKLIEEIDQQVMEKELVNKKFTPTPLDNLCCLQNINSTYNYLTDFIRENKNIQELITLIYKYNKTKEEISHLLKDSKIIILSDLIPTLISFNRNIGKDRDELTEEDIQTLYSKFIDSGFFEGERHVYEQNFCILTGENKNDIQSKKYKKDDYYDLLNKVNKKKLFHLDKSSYEEIEDKVSHIIDSNIYLQGNEFLTKFNTKLKTNKNTTVVWGEMKEQVELLSKEISKRFNKTESETETIQKILLTLGEKKNVLESDLKSMTEEEAYTKFYMEKINLVQSFILTYLKNTIFKIKNKKTVVEPHVPTEWNLDPKRAPDAVLIEKYSKIILDNNKYTDSFLQLGTSHPAMLEKIIMILNGTTNNLKILTGSINITLCEESKTGELYSNISTFLHYIFLFILFEILGTKQDLIVNEDDFIIEKTDEINDDYNFSQDLKRSNEVEADMLHNIIKHIGKDMKLLDDHSSDYIKSVIEKKSETLKEDTLKFVHELDKETWASLRMRISVGIDSWKTVTNMDTQKKGVYLYDRIIDEEENIQTNNEMESDQHQAKRDLGDNYSEEQFSQWKDNKESNLQADQLAYQERDIMADDDGDEDENEN